MAKRFLFGWLIVFVGYVCAPAYGQELDYFSLSPEELFNATVTSASKTEAVWWDIPAAIYVLSNEDIIRSGATSLPDVLRLVPGVNVAQVNTHTWAISVRGFNDTLANKLLVLIDGREVYNPLFSGVYWNLQDTILDDIERIEIIRGPGATLWGANAVNGVINIITKKTQDSQGGLINSLYGNQENGTLSARYGDKLGDTGHYRVYGKHLNRDEQRTVSGAGANDEWSAYRAGFRMDWEDKHSQDTYTLQSDTYFDRADRFTQTSSLLPPYNVTQMETVVSRGWNILGRWQHPSQQGGKFTLQSYADYTLHDQLLLRDERTSFDVDAQYEFPATVRQSVIVGGRYRYSRDNLVEAPSVSFSPASRDEQLWSAFIQDVIVLQPKTWMLTLGSKFDHNDYSGFEVQPNIRLQWHLSDARMSWLSVSRAVRTPSRLEHDANLTLLVAPPSSALPLPVRAVLVANQDFTSEELLAYELGYRQQWHSGVTLDTTVFHNDYDNLATTTIQPFQVITNGVEPNHLLLPFTLTNDTSGDVYGFETALRWKPLHQFMVSASYSQLTIDLHVPPDSLVDLKEDEGQSPHRQATLHTQWNITSGLSFDTILYYVDALPTFDTEDYWRLDIRWGWRMRKGMEFYLVGQNLLDDTHREFGSPNNIEATQIKRSIYGQFTWRF